MSGYLDTIFARASGAGSSAVCVIRLSGPDSARVVRSLAGTLPKPRFASLRWLRAPETGERLDHALVLWFPAPGSYTGEDSAELHLHGGMAVLAALASALVALGCRPAEPGEFTRRAFLNGKVDLTQAEAIADLIAAETQAQRQQALRQAEGALGEVYAGWTEKAKRLLAHQEAAIEFAMDDLPSDLSDKARDAAAALRSLILAHLADGRRGERLREGLSLVLLGAPNAGKSSLLNALLGREVAIVSAIPGTTRDVVEGRFELDGIPVLLADTAGLRQSGDAIEQEGVRRAKRRADEADLVLAVFAADEPPTDVVLAAMAAAPRALVVASKADLSLPPMHIAGREVLATSAKTGAGLEALRAALAREAAALAAPADTPSLTRARHRAALEEAAAQLAQAETAPLPELAAEGYRAALLALGRLTGRVGVEEILDSVFRDFCIGK